MSADACVSGCATSPALSRVAVVALEQAALTQWATLSSWLVLS